MAWPVEQKVLRWWWRWSWTYGKWRRWRDYKREAKRGVAWEP